MSRDYLSFSNRRPANGTRKNGFTLMELVIVVAIVGLLAAIALPSYSSYVLRANRTAARGVMSDMMARQESFYSDRKSYATTLGALGITVATIDREGQSTAANAIYTMSLTAPGTACPGTGAATATGFTINAVPTGAQTADTRCATLCLSSNGFRGATGTSAADCWVR